MAGCMERASAERTGDGHVVEDEHSVLPKTILKVRWRLGGMEALADVGREVKEEFAKAASLFRRGERIGLAVGSRGIANLPTLVRTAVTALQGFGVSVAIIPAMGSHGGATAEGQVELLASYGITAEAMGVPILSSMEVTCLGTTPHGVPV